MALQIRAHKDRVFAAVPVCSRMQARDAQHFPRCLVERDEGHGICVIDVSELCYEFMAEILYRREEASTQILRRLRREERAVKRFVVGSNGTNENAPIVLQRQMPLPLLRISALEVAQHFHPGTSGLSAVPRSLGRVSLSPRWRRPQVRRWAATSIKIRHNMRMPKLSLCNCDHGNGPAGSRRRGPSVAAIREA